MAIPPSLKHKIVMAYIAEHCTVGEIARRYNIHHKTVSRTLDEYKANASAEEQTAIADAAEVNRLMIGPFIAVIIDIYTKNSTIKASRLFQIVKERGYPGGEDHFRHQLVKLVLKPKRLPEAYLRLCTLPGDQAQVDWADFEPINVGNTTYRIRAFIMVLSHSRRIFVRFMLNMHFDSFVRGHMEAFTEWGGVPRIILCDNLKSAVIGRYKHLISFNDMYLKFAEHYSFLTEPVGIRKSNEKGRVERAVSYLRTNFFAGREITTLDALNKEVKVWCDTYAMERKWAHSSALTVRDAFASEAQLLSSLPHSHFDAVERIGAKVDKTAHVRYDRNDYSVPPAYVQQAVIIHGSEHEVKIYRGEQCIAIHHRSYSKGVAVQQGAHLDELRQYKQKAITHSLNYELIEKLASARTYLENAHPTSLQHTMDELIDDKHAKAPPAPTPQQYRANTQQTDEVASQNISHTSAQPEMNLESSYQDSKYDTL